MTEDMPGLDRVPALVSTGDCKGQEQSLLECPGVMVGAVADAPCDARISVICFGGANPGAPLRPDYTCFSGIHAAVLPVFIASRLHGHHSVQGSPAGTSHAPHTITVSLRIRQSNLT